MNKSITRYTAIVIFVVITFQLAICYSFENRNSVSQGALAAYQYMSDVGKFNI